MLVCSSHANELVGTVPSESFFPHYVASGHECNESDYTIASQLLKGSWRDSRKNEVEINSSIHLFREFEYHEKKTKQQQLSVTVYLDVSTALHVPLVWGNACSAPECSGKVLRKAREYWDLRIIRHNSLLPPKATGRRGFSAISKPLLWLLGASIWNI